MKLAQSQVWIFSVGLVKPEASNLNQKKAVKSTSRWLKPFEEQITTSSLIIGVSRNDVYLSI